MEKSVFKNKFASYLLVSLLGIGAGLLVAFFSRFPADDLWSFSLFSSRSLGFWIFSCSLIALFSERNFVAGIDVGIYVYLMYYVTGIFKRLAVVQKGYAEMSYFYSGLWQEIAYGVIPALICFVLAFGLWYGRKSRPVFVLLRFAPVLFILVEAAAEWVIVVRKQQYLFMAIVETVCVLVYLVLILKTSDLTKKQD